MAKRTILMVGNFLSGFGKNRGVCEELAVRLERADWEVITTSRFERRLPRLVDMLRTAWRTRREYDVAQIDVYSGRAFLWAELASRVVRIARKPYVLTLHGGDLPSFARLSPERVVRLLSAANAVTVPSRYLLERMQPYCKKLTLIPNPIELGVYPFRIRKRPQPHLVWLRAFHVVYNPSLVPRVLACLSKVLPSARATMIGPDKSDGSLQAMWKAAKQLEIADRISVCREIAKAEVPRHLEEGDIFLNTSSVDNTPVSVVEAMACGLCVVSTNVGGIPYLLEHEVTSILVPPNDPNAMADGILRLVRNPDLAGRVSQNGRRIVESFDWSIVLPQWDAILTSAERSSRHA